MSRTIDFHALQTLPPSNINRDDTGAPKTAMFGGVMRQRVSSQAWKHAIRKDFERHLDRSQLGLRSKRLASVIAQRVRELSPEAWDEARAEAAAEQVFAAAGIKLTEAGSRKRHDDDEAVSAKHGKETGYLLFLSNRQIDRAAQHIIDTEGAKLTKREAAALLDKEHSVDIAMFGRMVADSADYNVDAAVQVAHAIGTHESEPEFDFFTAVDDVVDDAGEETGAGMLGTVQMMSSTLYRYASIDLDTLRENLGSDEAVKAAVVAFARSFVHSLPTGKLNTFANWTLPELVFVTVRDDRAVSLVNAFEQPVAGDASRSRRVAAAEALASEARHIDAAYGVQPAAAWVVGVGELARSFEGLATPTTHPDLLEGLASTLAGGAA